MLTLGKNKGNIIDVKKIWHHRKGDKSHENRKDDY